MQKRDWRVEDTLFPVKEDPIFLRDGKDSGYKFIMREDTGDVISCVTNDYKLVENQTLFKSTDKIAKKLGGTLVEARAYNNKMTNYKWRFKTPIKLAKGEEHKPEIMIRNSYDGSCEVSIMAGAFRLVCSNGMVIGTVLDNVSNRHSVFNKNLEDIEGMIDESVEKITELLNSGYDRMSSNKPSQKHIIGLFKIFPTQANEQLTQYLIANKPKTFWDLYNAGTWLLSHGMNRNAWSTSKIESNLFKTVNSWAKA
tara:strand:- start:6064 stop:6825 length:762 start_codon:yes stop_codon:yes gene_type:complete